MITHHLDLLAIIEDSCDLDENVLAALKKDFPCLKDVPVTLEILNFVPRKGIDQPMEYAVDVCPDRVAGEFAKHLISVIPGGVTPTEYKTIWDAIRDAEMSWREEFLDDAVWGEMTGEGE
jgi:hypothetical protein